MTGADRLNTKLRCSILAATLARIADLKIQDDQEAMLQEGWLLCDAGDHGAGFSFLRRAIDRGYFAAPTLVAAEQFDALRNRPDFRKLLADAEAGRQRAVDAFREAGGNTAHRPLT